MMLDRRLIGLALAARGWFAATVLLGLAASAAAAGAAILTGQAVASVIGGAGVAAITWLILAVASLIVVRFGLLWGKGVVASVLGSRVKLRVRRRMCARLLELGPGYSTNLRTGQIQATMADGLEHLDPYVSKYLPQALIAFIMPILVVGYIAYLDVWVGAIVLLSAVLLTAGPRAYKATLGRAGERHWDTWTAVAARFLEGLNGMVTLKAFNASRRFGHELRDEAVRLYLATRHLLLVSLGSLVIIGVTHLGGLTAAAFVGALRVVSGDLAPTDLIIILFLTNEAYRPLSELAHYWHEGYLGISASSGIFALLDAPDVLRRHETRLALEPTTVPPAIRFEGVTFRYPGAERAAIRGLDMEIDAASSVALVGRSGAGKTTLTSLLIRAVDPQEGRITVDGTDIRSLDLADYRRQFAVVSQDVYLFHGTIAQNLRLAAPQASDAQLAEAARAANIHDFVIGLPDGYATMVGERGVRLSGGERQRLAIARALLKDAPVLILDEPTASLDGESERRVRDALATLMRGRTTVVISHRLSAVDFADRVYMLEDGTVLESGVPRELMATGGRFADLVQAQAVSA